MDKTPLVITVKTRLTEKIKHLELLITQTREANTETKSSMGDKYETSREMVEQEIRNLQRQLNETQAQQTAVKKLLPAENNASDFGALVETGTGMFYIATAVGEITLDDRKIMTVSTESPLAKALHGKKKGESFTLNGMTHTVKNID